MSVGFQLQADLLVGISKEEEQQNKENIPPLFAGSSESPFSCLHLLKRWPLQDITHLTATSANMDTIHNRRRTFSVMETGLLVESMTHRRNKKRKTINLSNDGSANLVNPKRPMLRKSFR
ncbi:hypothetical protein SUGI_0766500 [Cryptomeria japonica]|nr:hypothetical protein SUGI_0766500 [Cryptomeria japonica]